MTVPFAESLMIQFHSWLLVLSFIQTNRRTNAHSNKHSQTHTLGTFLLSSSTTLGHSLIHSFTHTKVLQVPTKFNGKTNKCVACQQSTIGPFDRWRLLPSCLFHSVFPREGKAKAPLSCSVSPNRSCSLSIWSRCIGTLDIVDAGHLQEI